MKRETTNDSLKDEGENNVDAVPLVVDLDRTLLRIDVLAEWFLRLLIERPVTLIRILLKHPSRLELKTKISENFSVSPEKLPFNTNVLALMEERRSRGSRVIIASASLPKIVTPIAELQGVSEVLASEDLNLKGDAKRDRIIEYLNQEQFDYVGDSKADFSIWEVARISYFAGNKRTLKHFSNKLKKTLVDLSIPSSHFALIRGMRLGHWVKNLLIAVPSLLAGEWSNLQYLPLLGTFLGLSMVASGFYLVNDILDVDADRSHPEKRRRAIATGEVTAQKGLVAAVILIAVGLFISYLGGGAVSAGLTAIYGSVSFLYSKIIKKVPYVDLLGLSSLYVFRIIVGALVTSTYISYWMMLFALMTFSALAALKRVTEITADVSETSSAILKSSRRGYVPSDLPSVRALAAGFSASSIALLGIYAQETYKGELQIMASMLLVVAFATWVLKFWLDSARGLLAHDPVKHALTDRWSMAILLVIFGVYFWLERGF